MMEVLRVSKSLKSAFPSVSVLRPGEHSDLTVILSYDYETWMGAVAEHINPVIVRSAEDAMLFLSGMRAVVPRGNWPKELDDAKIDQRSAQTERHFESRGARNLHA